MAVKSSIEWTDATWNPTYGCSMANGSENGGCLNCYAARLHARGLPNMVGITGKPLARILQSGPRWTGVVGVNEKTLELPRRWRKPRRVFVNSLSDLFHEALPDEAVDRVFAVMALCPQHTFQILTKRIDRALAYFMAGMSHMDARRRVQDVLDQMGYRDTADKLIDQWPLPNVWLGVSVENQPTQMARVPLLRQCPAAVRFISQEPQLASINWTPELLAGITWIIVGGESGPGARPFDIQWARNTIAQCKAAGVACFVKQFGAKPHSAADHITHRGNPIPMSHGFSWFLNDRKGSDMSEWPEDLRVREFPHA